MSQLDELRLKAEQAGAPEATCNYCSWFEQPKDGDMGACRRRRGEAQFRYGMCFSWTNGFTRESQIERDPNVVQGARPMWGAVVPRSALTKKDAPGKVDNLQCAEDGCDGKLILRWSDRFNSYYYACARAPACDGRLPGNPDGSPRGEPRTRELQSWRNKAHTVFDQLWKDGHIHRRAAYSWMRAATGLEPDKAHMSKMGIEECMRVIECVETMGPGTEFWERWKAEKAEHKRQKRRNARRSRTASSRKLSTTQ